MSTGLDQFTSILPAEGELKAAPTIIDGSLQEYLLGKTAGIQLVARATEPHPRLITVDELQHMAVQRAIEPFRAIDVRQDPNGDFIHFLMLGTLESDQDMDFFDSAQVALREFVFRGLNLVQLRALAEVNIRMGQKYLEDDIYNKFMVTKDGRVILQTDIGLTIQDLELEIPITQSRLVAQALEGIDINMIPLGEIHRRLGVALQSDPAAHISSTHKAEAVKGIRNFKEESDSLLRRAYLIHIINQSNLRQRKPEFTEKLIQEVMNLSYPDLNTFLYSISRDNVDKYLVTGGSIDDILKRGDYVHAIRELHKIETLILKNKQIPDIMVRVKSMPQSLRHEIHDIKDHVLFDASVGYMPSKVAPGENYIDGQEQLFIENLFGSLVATRFTAAEFIQRIQRGEELIAKPAGFLRKPVNGSVLFFGLTPAHKAVGISILLNNPFSKNEQPESISATAHSDWLDRLKAQLSS